MEIKTKLPKTPKELTDRLDMLDMIERGELLVTRREIDYKSGKIKLNTIKIEDL